MASASQGWLNFVGVWPILTGWYYRAACPQAGVAGEGS
jgi:hypothetical protein